MVLVDLLDEDRASLRDCSMIKSELVRRISSQNPHLFQRDIEKIVSAIFDEIVEALRRGDRVELRGFGVFSAKLRGPRIPVSLPRVTAMTLAPKRPE